MRYNKEHCDLSIFPTRTTFDETRYKNKELVPSNNTYVTVDGFFDHIDIDCHIGQPTLFHVFVDNIGFRGRAILLPRTHGNQCL